MPEAPEPPRAKPVNWYHPPQLALTGIEVATTALFGKRADARRFSALGPKLVEYRAPQVDGSLWIDFAADTGDGFRATFTVARALASDIQVRVDGAEKTLPSGHVLVLGGDEVYPTPSGDAYALRFLGPFVHARPVDAPVTQPKQLFVIPGNHDWYDGLVEFCRVFCGRERIGPWQTEQAHSYFALRLSERLWLLGLDTQISQDIDRDQLQYFLNLIASWPKGEAPAQVVVVTAEPHWERLDYDGARKPCVQRVSVYRTDRPILLGKLLTELEARGIAVVLQLTGDLHMYRRYSTEDARRHLIIAGGGGAFTHPTHTREEAAPCRPLPNTGAAPHGPAQSEPYVWQERDFPEPRVSRRMAWKNLLFPYYNPWFVPVLGLAYLTLGLIMPRPLTPHIFGLMDEGVRNVVAEPGAMLVMASVALAVVLFTDTTSRRYRWLGGALHAGAHLTGALFVAWTLRFLRLDPYGSPLYELLASHAAYCGGTIVLGGLLGALIWGLYLLVSINLFGRHSNEAFSSLHDENYKCFVRMELSGEALTLYTLGLRVTPSHYRWDGRKRTWLPGEEPRWELIDGPVRIALDAREP